jgi:hypothetical protein
MIGAATLALPDERIHVNGPVDAISVPVGGESLPLHNRISTGMNMEDDLEAGESAKQN